MQRIAIIGAGPVGLEAALYARHLGHEVRVYEAGKLAEHMLQWGHVRLFSPFSLNHSSLGLQELSQQEDFQAPKEDSLLTGAEHREQYLLPLSRLPLLQGCIQEGTRVVSIGRTALLKGELIGSKDRLEHPFRLLLEDPNGVEHVAEADVLLDCSGVYSRPNHAGDGGIPAPGERALRARGRLVDRIPDVLGQEREQYAGKHSLLVGGGASAATVLRDLIQLAGESAGTRVTWLLRQNGCPYELIAGDPLEERHALYSQAQKLFQEGHAALELCAGAGITGFSEEPDGRIQVQILRDDTSQKLLVDNVVATVGFQPDNSLYEELQVHECYASRGPMKLAAALLSAGGASGDCLAQESPGPETLRNPEPGFFILGAKSYGKNSQFLIRLGLEQIRDAFKLIQGDLELDLYGAV